MTLKRAAQSLPYFIGSLLATAGVAGAQIDVTTIMASDTVGNIANLSGDFTFIFNLLRYLGWAGVIVGVGLAIFALIYKLFSTDNEEAMKTVQGYVTKAVIIVLAGILLISAGFIVRTIGGLLGFDTAADTPFEVPSELSI